MAPERRFVSQLTAAERIEQVFLISQPQLRTTTRGDYYIAAFLADRTGKTNGRMWQASEAVFKSLPSEGFVMVTGRTENYQQSLQIVIDAIRPVANEEVALAEFMPATDKDVDEMFARVVEILQQVETPGLAALAGAFLADEALMERFRTAPAAIALHHAYLGGLLEHTLSVMELGLATVGRYPELNRDLMLTALFLHDMGKTSELDYEISFKYSDEGRLLGHLVKGTLLVQEKAAGLGSAAREELSGALLDAVNHIIVSHHGLREYGCPVLPAMPEAYAVHYLDNLDSKMALTFTEIAKDPGETNWTNYIRALESPLFKVRPEARGGLSGVGG